MSTTKLPNFGQAWSCTTDLTMPSIMASGFRVVAEAVVRRWSTPRGTFISDPNYGFDISDYISDDINPQGLGRISQAAAAEAEKDERVLRCSSATTGNMIQLATSGVLSVNALIQTAQGPFKLVLAVSQVTTTILQVSG